MFHFAAGVSSVCRGLVVILARYDGICRGSPGFVEAGSLGDLGLATFNDFMRHLLGQGAGSGDWRLLQDGE